MRHLIELHAKEFIEALRDVARTGGDTATVRLEACRLAFAYLSGPPPTDPVAEVAPAPAAAATQLLEARRVLEGVAALAEPEPGGALALETKGSA